MRPQRRRLARPMPGREPAVKTLFRLIVLVLLLGGWGLAALSLHVVRTPQTLTIVPKNRLGIVDTVVDVRDTRMASFLLASQFTDAGTVSSCSASNHSRIARCFNSDTEYLFFRKTST